MYLCASLKSLTLVHLQSDFVRAVDDGADLVELRLDRLRPDELDRIRELEAWLRQNGSRLIITFRAADQGGSRHVDTAERAATLFWAAGLGVRFVDFESAHFACLTDLKDNLVLPPHSPDVEHPSGLLLSEHHFDGRPPRLQNTFLQMTSTAADAIKLVWRARSVQDNFEAFDLLRSQSKPATVFCLGDDGQPSRILGKKFGNLITYCALREGDETAPGQPTLDEMLNLYRWRSINEATCVYGLIGDPVAHSLSPHVYNASFAACELDAVYLPFRVPGDGFAFADFIKAVCDRPWLDIGGFSVTTPHKQNAFLLVEDDLDPVCKRIGAVNTLRFDNGAISGANTDYQAALNWIARGLQCDLPALADKRFDVLGAGGFARAVVAALRLVRANVTIHNRTPDHARILAEAFTCQTTPLDASTRFRGNALINCTTVGMWPDVDRSPIDPHKINPKSVVFDAIYHPIQTRLLKDAHEQGCRTIGGLELFIEQAVMQFAVLTGRIAPREVIYEAACKNLTQPSAA